MDPIKSIQTGFWFQSVPLHSKTPPKIHDWLWRMIFILNSQCWYFAQPQPEYIVEQICRYFITHAWPLSTLTFALLKLWAGRIHLWIILLVWTLLKVVFRHFCLHIFRHINKWTYFHSMRRICVSRFKCPSPGVGCS